MCKRQIDRRPTAPTPSSDNEPSTAIRVITQDPAVHGFGILSIVLERAEPFMPDLVADGLLIIQRKPPLV
jgi:hypothetical protein